MLSKNKFNNAPVLCLGGAGRINSELLEPYDNLYCVTTSIIEEIQRLIGYPEEGILRQPITFLPNWRDCIDLSWNPELLEFIHEETFEFEEIVHSVGGGPAAQFFLNDPGHPNGTGYIVIVDIIIKYIEDNFGLPKPLSITY